MAHLVSPSQRRVAGPAVYSSAQARPQMNWPSYPALVFLKGDSRIAKKPTALLNPPSMGVMQTQQATSGELSAVSAGGLLPNLDTPSLLKSTVTPPTVVPCLFRCLSSQACLLPRSDVTIRGAQRRISVRSGGPVACSHRGRPRQMQMACLLPLTRPHPFQGPLQRLCSYERHDWCQGPASVM